MKRLFYAIPAIILGFLYTNTASAHTMANMPAAAPESNAPYFLILWAIFVFSVFLYYLQYTSRQAGKSGQANSYYQFGKGLIAIFAVLTLFINATHLGCTCLVDISQVDLEKHAQYECSITPVAILTSTIAFQPNAGLFEITPSIPAGTPHLFSFSINNKSPPAQS